MPRFDVMYSLPSRTQASRKRFPNFLLRKEKLGNSEERWFLLGIGVTSFFVAVMLVVHHAAILGYELDFEDIFNKCFSHEFFILIALFTTLLFISLSFKINASLGESLSFLAVVGGLLNFGVGFWMLDWCIYRGYILVYFPWCWSCRLNGDACLNTAYWMIFVSIAYAVLGAYILGKILGAGSNKS